MEGLSIATSEGLESIGFGVVGTEDTVVIEDTVGMEDTVGTEDTVGMEDTVVIEDIVGMEDTVESEDTVGETVSTTAMKKETERDTAQQIAVSSED